MLLPQEHCFNQKENKTKKHCSFLAEIHGAIFSCSELRNVCLKTEKVLILPSFIFLSVFGIEQEAQSDNKQWSILTFGNSICFYTVTRTTSKTEVETCSTVA